MEKINNKGFANIATMISSVDDNFYKIFKGHYPIYLVVNTKTCDEILYYYQFNCLKMKDHSKINEYITKYRVFDITINNDLEKYEYNIIYPENGECLC